MDKHILYRFLFIFLFAIFSCNSYSESRYPIYVTPMLTPPYSLTLSDYTKPGSQKLFITIQVTDIIVTNLPVRLHIRIENTSGVIVETLPNITTMPLFLGGGEMHVMFGEDLKDYFNINNLHFQGYSKEQYLRTGQLPEGFYRFTVEVRHFHTGLLISNRNTAMAWIAQGKPPALKHPEDKAELGQIAGMPLTFSWIPNNTGIPSGGLQYTLEMWEMRIQGIDPNVIAASMQTFYSTTQFTNTLTVHPAELMLTPGMTYAWRVTVSDVMDQVSFFMNGHSEIRTFTYQCKCDDVLNFTAKPGGEYAVMNWNPSPQHTSFNLEIENRQSGYKKSIKLYDNTYKAKTDRGKTYHFRVQGICNGDERIKSEFTEWQPVTVPELPKVKDYCPDCECGVSYPVPPITNFNLRNDLQPGDTIQSASGRSRFILKTVENQGGGLYKGKVLFWIEIWNLKVLCDYWDLSVNTDNQIVNWKAQSVYNPQFHLSVTYN